MKFTYIIEEEILIKDFLIKKGYSRNILRSIKNNLELNNQKTKIYFIAKKGDSLTVMLPIEENSVEKEDIPLDILYEDEYLLVCNKPSKMSVMVTKAHPNKTLSNALSYYFSVNKILSFIHLVNRLDNETSGVLIVAKNAYIKALLQNDLPNIKKIYYGLVYGCVNDDSGVISAPIAKTINDGIKREINEEGKDSLTYFEVLKRSADYTLVKFNLATGRTHQIRLHSKMISLGIVGDKLYASEEEHMYLHAKELEFTHPITKQNIKIESELPEYFKRKIEEINWR